MYKFLETAVDANGDGITDSAYRLVNSIYSNELLLIPAYKPQQLIAPVTNFEIDHNSSWVDKINKNQIKR